MVKLYKMIGLIILVCQLSSFTTFNATDQLICKIGKETWGTFSKDDYNKLLKYSANHELDLLQKMIDERRTIHLMPGTKIIVEDAGFLSSEIRLPNSERIIWVVSESIDC